jgi:hypothetical protein
MAADLDADQRVAGQLRTSWFSQVYQISDLGLQRRTWLDLTNQNPHWSYIEFVCSYPDDDQLLYAHKQGWLTAKEFKILSAFRRTLIGYSPPGGNHYDNAAVLSDPAWQSVAEAAERARQQLLSITTDQLEREMLLGAK